MSEGLPRAAERVSGRSSRCARAATRPGGRFALAPRQGAGTLVWVRSWARMEAAVVLEPEQSLAAARPVLLAALSAFADAAGAPWPRPSCR